LHYTARQSTRAFAYALVVLLLLAGCSPKATTAPVGPTEGVAVSPLQSPVQAQQGETLQQIPTPSPGLGVVVGTLIDQTQGIPMVDRTLYLAPLIKSEDGSMEVARLVAETAPVAQTDAAGRFVFADVTPGRYGIVLSGQANDYLLADFRSESEVLVTVEADQTAETGEIWVVPPEQ
jgi:hypothetical protein